MFQSTPSKRKETWTFAISSIMITCFNPLLPSGRRRLSLSDCLKLYNVSIHSFQAEGDRLIVAQRDNFICFNPLLPSGRRPLLTTVLEGTLAFQSTPSKRKETSCPRSTGTCQMFQSTPSKRKETYHTCFDTSTYFSFQSTPSKRKET